MTDPQHKIADFSRDESLYFDRPKLLQWLSDPKGGVCCGTREIEVSESKAGFHHYRGVILGRWGG